MSPGLPKLVSGTLAVWSGATPAPGPPSLCISPLYLCIGPPVRGLHLSLFRCPTEHQAVIGLCPVLRHLLSLGDSEVFRTHLQRVFHQHHVLSLHPGVQSLFYAPTDGLGCGDMSSLLQDHCLTDNVPLQVPQSVPHPIELRPQRPDEPPPESPSRRIIAPLWHYREVTQTRLPRRVVADASIKVGARVGMYAVFVDLP